MSFTVHITGLVEMTDYLRYVTTEVQQGAAEIARLTEVIGVPLVRERALAVWNVRTGRYAAGWRSVPTGDGAYITNDVPYAAPLEWGWRTRGHTFVFSPGVLAPILPEIERRIQAEMELWLARILQHP